MTTEMALPSPRQTFDDNMRPTQFLLSVYRLLDSNDQILTDGEKVAALRRVVEATDEEDVMLFYNEIFLGLVRESAQLPRSQLRRGALSNLLRQAVVVACTALETYLPAVLRTNLPLMIKARKREFVPRGDVELTTQFKLLTFSLDEGLRIMAEANPEEFISTKILGQINYSYLSGSRGVAVTGKLLGISNPWHSIAKRLRGDRDEPSEEQLVAEERPEEQLVRDEPSEEQLVAEEAAALQKALKQTVDRRNDIVHRADRSQSDPAGKQQTIAYAWAKHAVNIVEDVCHTLDELVAEQVAEIRVRIEDDGLSDGQSTA